MPGSAYSHLTIVTRLRFGWISAPMVKTVKVSEFKAKCLKLLADVAETGEDLVITKRGKVLARVVPERAAKPVTLQGSMRGLIEICNPDKTLPRAWDDEPIDRRMDRLAENVRPEPPADQDA